MRALLATCLTISMVFTACRSTPEPQSSISVARLGAGDVEGFERLRRSFATANPGYDMEWHAGCSALEPANSNRVVFVQGPAGRGEAPTVGDILLVAAGEAWSLESGGELDLLAFHVPHEIPANLPQLIRPDWDPLITDTPGGCAEETGAYRRILLTWLEDKGPYVLHSLNAHRVRINDSFSHYHPVDGGFDELYLIQMAGEDARVLTSEEVSSIEARDVTRETADALIQSRALEVGDLVYLPRGTMHRGLGGALVQVISVPGFVPNSEIGLDHHLFAINEQLGLTGDQALPLHAAAARTAVVK